MWIACRREITADQVREHQRWREHRLVNRRRVEDAQKRVIELIVAGVPAMGSLADDGNPDDGKRVLVPSDFLKDGAYVELTSGSILAEPAAHWRDLDRCPRYLDVRLDRSAFLEAIGYSDAGARTTEVAKAAPAVVAAPESEKPKRRRRTKPKPYVTALRKHLKWRSESRGDLNTTTVGDLARDARKRLMLDGVPGVPKGRTQFNGYVSRFREEILAEERARAAGFKSG